MTGSGSFFVFMHERSFNLNENPPKIAILNEQQTKKTVLICLNIITYQVSDYSQGRPEIFGSPGQNLTWGPLRFYIVVVLSVRGVREHPPPGQF